MLRSALAIAAVVALPSLAMAQADPILGSWTRDTGASKINFAPCGGAICGTLTWVKDTSGPAKVGQRVFTNVKQTSPGKYSGTAFNPEDGKSYSGTLTVNGNSLSGGGCVLGGLICRTVNYRRG
ncbi:MAG TPA: DUF2147 domain-containing protein [Beijerinckiaceae bacterium]|nr:DUF2147 domain-containing protein [Beijerinckiaceae bacterium]